MDIKGSISGLGTGARKIANKKILAVISFILFFIVLVTMMVIAGKGQQNQAQAKSQEQVTQQNALDVDQSLNMSLASAPSENVIPSKQAMMEAKEEVAKQEENLRQANDENSIENRLKEEAIKEYLVMRRAKSQSLLAALKAPTHIEYEKTNSPTNTANSTLDDAKAHLAALEKMRDGVSPTGNPKAENKSTLDGYLDNTRTALSSPYTLSIGTLIPATLGGALNSDIAGTVTATISQNVYDSATGSTLLFPQGAELVGQYNGQVAFGQERLPVQWYRINFPDGSTVNLRGMSGVDVEGQTGFEGDVNNHYWRLFGQSTLLGLIAGGTTAAISTNDNGDSVSPSQTIANGVIQQYSQVGTTLIQKNLQIAPTITVPSGYEFNIILTKDIVIPPYSTK